MTWSEFTQNDAFRNASPEGRAAAKQKFFERVMVPEMRNKGMSDERITPFYQRFMETPDDTGEGLIRSALGSAARGFFDPLAAAPEVAGAYLGIEGLEEFGGDVRGAIEGAFPVNPAEQGLVTDTFGVLGQVGQIVATGGGGALAGAKLLGKGATEAAKRQAMKFGATAAQQTAMGSSAVAGGLERAEQLGLEGGDRLLRGAIAGGTELLAERLGGFATELGPVNKMLGESIESGFMKPIIRGIGTEAGEEGLAEAAGQATDIAMAPEAAPGMDLKNIGYAMLLGGVGGAAFGGIEAAITPRTKKAFDGTTDFIPSSGPPPGMTVEEAEDQDLLKYGNAGEIIGYVLPVSDETIEGDLPLTVDTNVEPLVENVAAAPEASATAAALRRIVVEDTESGLTDAGMADAKANLLTGMPMRGGSVIDLQGQRILEGQPAPIPARAETVTPAPVAEEIITEQENVPLTQETLQQEQSRGQELQEPRELPILPAEPTAQAPEAAVGDETVELEQQKATLPVDGEGAMLQGGDVRQEETQQVSATADVPTESLPAGQLTPRGVGVARDATKPEQVSPSDLEGYLAYAKDWANTEPSKINDKYKAEFNASDEYMKANPYVAEYYQERQKRLAEISKDKARKDHIKHITAAVVDRLPVSADAVDAYGIRLPDGYVKDGELYVFQQVSPEPTGAVPTESLPATGQPTSGDVGVARDATKPEQMTPGEHLTPRIAKLEQEIAELESNVPNVNSNAYLYWQPKLMEAKRNLSALKDDRDEPRMGRPWNAGLQQRFIFEAMDAEQPVSAAAVDSYKIELPQGYTLNEAGDLYVFNAPPPPPAQSQPSPPATQETKPQAAAPTEVTATQESTAAQPAEAVVELTELPSYFQRNPQQKKLWDVDESYAEPARISQSVGDKIGPRGTAFTVEQLMYQIAALREFVSNMNGRLLRGGDKGASTKELAEKWTTLRGFEALAAEYAAENPQEWQGYRNRQNELLGLEAGADVIVPYPSPDTAPLGNIGKLDKKFSKNWRVIYPNGETALFHPTALRAVSDTAETVDADVIEEVTPLTQAQAAIIDKLLELEARDAQRRGLGFDYPRARIGRLPGDQNAYISRPDQKNVGVLSPDGSIKMLSPEESVSIQGEINAFEKRQAAQIDKRMATLREEAKKQSESKLYQLTPSDPVVRRLDGKWINNNTGKPLSRSRNDQRLLSQLENNPNIESYQVVAQSTDGGVSFIPASRAAQPAAGETGDAEVASKKAGVSVPRKITVWKAQRQVGDIKEGPKLGEFYSDNEQTANSLADLKGDVTKQELELKKPLVIPAKEDGFEFYDSSELNAILANEGVKFKFSDVLDGDEVWRHIDDGSIKLINALKKAGFDSIQFPEFLGGREQTTTLVFQKPSAGVAISPTGETVQSSETPSALSKLQSYISTLSPKAQAAWTPERLAAAQSYYATGNESALEPLTATQRKIVKREGASESDAAAYEAEQKREFALRNPQAADDAEKLLNRLKELNDNATRISQAEPRDVSGGDTGGTMDSQDVSSARTKAVQRGVAGLDWANMGAEQRRKALLDFATATARSLQNNSVRLRDVSRIVQEEKGGAYTDGTAKGGVLSIKISVQQDTGLMEKSPSAEAAFSGIYKVVEEEVMHAVHTVAAFDRWKEAGSPGDFKDWFIADSVKNINDLIALADQMESSGNTEAANRIFNIIKSASDLYFNEYSDYMLQRLESDPAVANTLYLEMARMLAQLDTDTLTTEAEPLRFYRKVVDWLNKALSIMRDAAKLVKTGALGEALKRDVAAITSAMREVRESIALLEAAEKQPPAATEQELLDNPNALVDSLSDETLQKERESREEAPDVGEARYSKQQESLDAKHAELEKRAKAGDKAAEAEAQRMVADAARSVNFTESLMHGSPVSETTVFRTPLYLTDSTRTARDYARSRAGDGRIYNVFLNKGKELNLFDYKHWPELVSTLDANGSDTTALKKAIVDTLYPEQFGDGNDRTWENYSSNVKKLESQGVDFFWDVDGNELSSTLSPERGFAALDQSSRVDALFDLGFDTLIQPEGGYSIEDGAAWIVKSPSQIKSADPFTYSNDGKLIPLSERFQQDSPDIRYKKILRSADGNIRRTGVKSTPARAARNSYIGVIPGVENTWLGTVEDFDAEFPDGYPFDSKTTTPPADTEALVAEDGRAFIFIDRVQVLDGDAERAEQHGTSPSVEAIKRLLRHESFVHRGFMSLPGPLKARFADFVASGVIPEAELDHLVSNGYPQYKGWRDNKTTEMLAAEEWLAQRVERMGRIPQSGPIASIMDWLRDVWRWLTGGETTDLDKLRNTMRAMHKALGALDPKQRIVMEMPDAAVMRRSVAQTQQDQEYLAAVERGDMETAQRMVDEAEIIKKHGQRIGGIVNSLASVLRDGDSLTTEGNAYGFEIVTDEVKGGELYISWIENKDAPKKTVADVLRGLSDLFDLKLTPLGGSQEGYYESLGFVKKGKDMVLARSSESADPVTYDSNGAPIPLSQRFQSTSSDIRYSKVQRPDPILTQPSRLRGNVPQKTKPNAQRRSVSEIFEGLDGAIEIIPRQYFPIGSKEKGNEFSATEALLSWSKDLLKPYAEDIGGLIEFLAILRSDERLQNELKLGPRSGAVVMPFLAQEAANRANALGSTDMRNAFLMEYDALGTAGGQNLWAFNIISRLPEFSSNTYSSTLDKTEEQNFAATVDKKINKSRTIQDVVSNLPEAGEVAADNVSDGLADEEMIRLSVLELGVLAQDDPELRDLLEELIATTLDLGEMSGAPERASIAARRVKREFASEEEKAVVFEQLKSRQTEILQAIQDKLKAKKADTAKTPAKEKASKPIETAKEIINKITTTAAKVPAKKKQPDAVRSLYRKHLKKPMSEAEFSAEAKAAGLDAATTKGLYDAINLEIVAIEIQAQAKAAERAQTKELKKAEREAEKYQNQAEAKINEIADALADPSLTQDKEKVVNPLTEIYQNQIKTPIAEAQFVEQVVALGVDEETATLLFSIAAMDRQARIDIRVAREDLRRREMSEAQASKLIYAQEEELRQGSKDREPSKSGDSINKAFREQVVNPLSQEKFRERLDKLKVSRKLADRLYATAERVATDNERAEVYRKRVALLDVDSAALTRFVNDLRLKGKLTGEPIQWRDLLSLPVAHQDTVKAELLARVKRHEALRNLSTGEQQAIADALNTIWQRERRKVFQAMIKKADLMGVSKEDQEVIVDAMPALLKYINQGMLGTSAFYRAVGEKFGIAPISAEARKQVEEMAAKMQEKDLYSFERAVLAEKILKILQNNTQLSRAEILSSFWVTSVLSGGRTIFDMALGVLNGGFSIAKKMITATIETRSPKAAIEGLTAFGQGIWMGAQVAAKNLIRPEEGLLASRNPAVADYFDDGARGAGLTTGDKLLLHKGDKPKDKLRRGLGVWMSFFERLFSGLDHINSTATMMGTMRMAAAMNPKLYNAALTPTKQDYANALERAKLRLPDGSNAAQIRLAQSIIEDGQHILERGLDESFMSQWRQLVADSRAEGNTASYQEDPTGAGGLLYSMVRNITSGLEDKTKGYRDEARVALAEARKTGRGVATSAVNYFVASLGYLLGTQAQNLLGVRFMRFTGNKLNELISFIPVLGMARLQEKGMVSGEEYTLRGQNVRANQVLGWMSAVIYFSLLKGLDEEDDEERGWIVNGSWENLTPERKSQLMSDGFKPNTVAFFDKDTGRWTSYNFVSWPFAGWMAAFGSVSDYKRLTPDKWNEKILIDKTMAAAYAGAFAITDISSLSSLTEMFGRSTYTTDPAEGFQKRVVKGAANYLGGLFPKTLKDFDAWFDETNYKPEETWEHFAKEVPFYRRSVGAPLRDIFYEKVQVSRTPWSRAIQISPDDPAYRILGRLNSNGIWITPANPSNRKVKRGGKLRDMTDEESNAYMAEVGKRYKEFVMKQGDRLLEMDVDRAEELVSKYTARIREIAFKRAIATAGKAAIPSPE